MKESKSIKSEFKRAAAGGLQMPLGHLEEAILRMASNADAITTTAAQARLRDVFQTDISPSSMYTVLQRLEKDGYTKSVRGEPTTVRGGKAMNQYSITPEGRAALEKQERKTELIRSLSGTRPVSRHRSVDPGASQL